MLRICRVTVLLGLCLAALLPGAETYRELSEARIAEIANWLPEQPVGFGKPGSDRAFWTSPAVVAKFPKVLAEAEALLGRELPPWSDELYLEFSKIGQRPPGEKMLRARAAWLHPLVFAECREWQGRFLPLLATTLAAYVQDPTWTLPAHDGGLGNFTRKDYSIDLRSAAFAADLAAALYLLGDRLDAKVRSQVTAALEERIFAPMRKSLRTGKGNFWLTADMNWNSVCLAGAIGAALCVIPARDDRALFVAAGERYSQHYLKGYRNDGYCDEGGGYWSYGFSRYVFLREMLHQATGGKIELFAETKIRNIVLFGARYQLTDRLMPTFADCRVNTRADATLIAYGNQVLGLGLTTAGKADDLGSGTVACALLTPTPVAATAISAADTVGLSSWFPDVGVAVSRPAPGGKLAVAIKAGGNGNHSHNDVGSFIISAGSELMVGDPGGPFAYDNKTFTAARYHFKVFNSHGHPLPVIGGALQILAVKAKPVVKTAEFTPAQDDIVIDLTSAYAVPGLTSLERSLRHVRGESGSISLSDTMAASEPTTFVSALTTRATVTQVDATHLRFVAGKQTVIATVEAPSGWIMTSEAIDEQHVPTFTRLAFALPQPVTAATITFTFRSAP